MIYPSHNEPKGFVYLLRSQRTGLHKIGLTMNCPAIRIAQINSDGFYQAVFIHAFNTIRTLEIERLWHNRFWSKRVDGEWFDLEDKHVEIFTTAPKFIGPSDIYFYSHCKEGRKEFQNWVDAYPKINQMDFRVSRDLV